MKYDIEIVRSHYAENDLAPEFEFKFHPDRDWRFDLAWPEEKVALECQGGLFTGGGHTRGGFLLKEHEKLNAAAVLGWRVLFCVPKDICMNDTIDTVKAALLY